MVYVNSKKFACESCIKGHRSSSCHHTDRPLFEIKKKGRPVSQCTKCRELRQSKKLHSKCTCNHIDGIEAMQPVASSSGSKPRRFIPIVPALPNGLRDVLSQSSMSLPPDSRQRVDSLLNPCDCKSVWKCKCRDSKTSGPSLPETHVGESTNALSTLAQAAAMCCTPSASGASSRFPDVSISKKSTNSPRSRPGSPNYVSIKRQKHAVDYPGCSPGPDLAPILYTETSSSSAISTPIPDFASMPPMSQITSLAGSGCTCGVQCACPGCVEHRGSEHASHERRDCAHGCGTCVDHSIGMSLPSMNSSQPGPSTSILDRFFARAAALPPPPVHRNMSSYHLDPMNTAVYTTSARSQGQPFAFGLVNLPKLECCGGQCNCPSGRCTCRVSCAGRCTDTSNNKQSAERGRSDLPTPSMETSASTQPLRSCCAGKS